eukprot:4681294-Alexandrium_andersonii.AAC.1
MALAGSAQATAAAPAFAKGPFAWAGAAAFHEERLAETAQAAEEASRALAALAGRGSPQVPSPQAA